MAREELVKVPAVILGSRLRGKRKALKMSQHQLGGEDFSPSYVSAVERGKIRPSLKALYILADRLGEPVTYFLEDEGVARFADTVDGALMSSRISMVEGKAVEAIAELRPLLEADLAPQVQARVRLMLGEAYLANHQPAEALHESQEAVRLAEACGDDMIAVQADLAVGEAYLAQHQPSLAVEVHRRCLHALTQGESRDVTLLLQCYSGLVQGLLSLDRIEEATAYQNDVSDCLADVSDLRSLAAALWATSQQYAQVHNMPRARVYAEKAMCAVDALRTFSAGARMLAVEAASLAATGQTEAAMDKYRTALEMSIRIGDQRIEAMTTIRMGVLAARQADYARAHELITQGIALAHGAGDDAGAGEGQLALAQALQAQGQRQAADEQFRAAIARLETASSSGALSDAYFRFGQALASWGEAALGSEYLQKAYLASRQT